MKGKSLTFWIGALMLVVMLVFTGVKYLQKYYTEKDLTQVSEDLKVANASLVEAQEGNLTGIISAKKTLDGIKSGDVKWSKVLTAINRTVPKDTKTNVLSYSGSGGQEISMNVSALADRENSYLNVSDFISAFDESANFVDSFVPSISRGVDPQGNDILSFSFNTRYVEEVVEFDENQERIVR